MTTVDQIKDALSTLTLDPAHSLAVIDAEIEDLEAEVEKLKLVRRTLAKGSTPSRRSSKPKQSANCSSKLGHWDEAEKKIFDYLSSQDEDIKFLPGEIAKALGMNAIQVGKAVAISERMEKAGAYVVLVRE